VVDARQGDGGGLDLRPWAAGVDAGLVVDLLWPLRFQPAQALPWVADILERATMAERRLPVLADWARRWRVIEGDSRGDLPLVHARWVGDVGGGDEGRGPREPTPRGDPPRVRARRSTARRSPRARASSTGPVAAAPMTHSNADERGQARVEIEGLPRGEAGPSGPSGATGARGETGRDGARGPAGASGAVGRSATADPRGAPVDRGTPTVRGQESAPPGGDAALDHPSDAVPSVSEAGSRQDLAKAAMRGPEAEPTLVVTSSASTPEDGDVAMPHVSAKPVVDAGDRPSVRREAQVQPTTPEVTSMSTEPAPTRGEPGARRTATARVRARRVSATAVSAAAAPMLEHASPRPQVNAPSLKTGAKGQDSSASLYVPPPSTAGEGAAARPRAQARTSATGSETPLVEATDRAARGPAGAGMPPLPRGSARPRVQARRADDLPIEATMYADPRRPVRQRGRVQASARPRVAGAPVVDDRLAPELDHLAAASVVAARAQAATASATAGAQPEVAAGVTAPATTQAAAAAPEVDIDALVTTVKKRLAREIRWERELRRAIG
jgi:hypothetical protein